MSTYKKLILALGATLLLKGATVIPALVLAQIIDRLSGSQPPSLMLLSMFMCLLVLQALMTPLQAWCLGRLCQDEVRVMSSLWCRALLNKRFESFGKLQGGLLVKVLDRGITAQERWLTFLIGSAWPVLAEAIVLAGLFLYFGAAPVLAGLIGLSIVYLLANNALVRWRRPHIEAVNEREDQLAEQWVDTFASASVVKLELAENAAMRPVDETLIQYANAAVRVATSGGWLLALKIIFIGFGSTALLAWGMIDQSSTSPSLSLGELVALFTLVGGLLGGVAHLAEGWRMLDQFRVDKQRLEQWLRLPDFGSNTNLQDAASPQTIESTLTLHPCSFAEGSDIRLHLDNPLVIHKGESVALVGPSGSGKSTLLHALAGTLHATREHLYIDNKPVTAFDATGQLQRLRLCPQAARFIPGTLPRAVLFEHSHDRQHIETWMNRIALENSFYDRQLDGRGDSISGGEAKRLSLLRLLNRPGDYNLFDEPTTGLDGPLARQTWDLLFETFKSRGLICVTHDQDALARFDRVIRVTEGRLHESPCPPDGSNAVN